MPELPEVETTRRGLTPHLAKQTIQTLIARQTRLRWPIPTHLKNALPGQIITQIDRRGKYLLLTCTRGTLIIHLGMSGSLRILLKTTPATKHDHVDIILRNGTCLRFNDPRRFGCILWTTDDVNKHDLLKNLGPEPLSRTFTGDYLYNISRGRRTPIKTFIMDGQIVVGVGNIYANEALFKAGIHPKKAVGKITLDDYKKLANAIKKILTTAIKQGGTTLRNFTDSNGKPGYFKQLLRVYGRGKLPCYICQTQLKEIRLGQRSTVYCTKCQS